MASRTFKLDYGSTITRRASTSNPISDFHEIGAGSVLYGCWTGSTENKPPDQSNYYGFWIQVASSDNYKIIFAANIGGDKLWLKRKNNGTWLDWKSVELT